MIDVPHEVIEHVSWLIYARRRELRSRWRRLSCFQQAVLVLVHLRKNETLQQVGVGFGVSTATAGRYVTEGVDVLADHAPTLLDALHHHDPNEFLILDGTLIRTDRVAADEPYYSQKHRHHGMNVQVLARPDGTALWYSRALPARTPADRACAVTPHRGSRSACAARSPRSPAFRSWQRNDSAPAHREENDLREPAVFVKRHRITACHPRQPASTCCLPCLSWH
ncbi:transposase family protein [Streptomyces sp. NBC_01613]|uniref:transposase family protein n=1 Tax=Streptomyces sp. NBC_01613 TaxID=2975896 RepID=UPI00386AACFB